MRPMLERGRSPKAGTRRADALRLLEVDGCALCRVRDEAEETWLRWFELEYHSDGDTLSALRRSVGFCPAHTRRLIILDKPAVVRRPWDFVLRGALQRAERLIQAGVQPAPSPCPACAAVDERVRGARATIGGVLELPEVAAVLREHQGLCYPHLRGLLPELAAPRVAVAAEAVRDALASEETEFAAAAGIDRDAEYRERWFPVVAACPAPVDLPPAERLAADLASGSCPCCRRLARAEHTYMAWLLREEEPSAHDAQLCPRHLHDVGRRAGDRAPALQSRGGLLHERVDALATTARRVAGSRPTRWWSGRAAPGTDTPQDRYQRAVMSVTGDHGCRACRSAASAAERCLALMAAVSDDARVRRALDEGHGVCLRHGERLAGIDAAAAAPYLRRLRTRLRETAWEVSEDGLKQAWDLRHEPAGRERTAWRRVPAIIDGRAYLGLADSDIWPS